VYGGSVDFKTGKVRVTHGIVDLGSLTWSAESGNRFKSNEISNNINYTANQIFNGAAEKYQKVSINTMNGEPELACICSYQTRFFVRTGDSTEPSGNVVYKLATPIELTLTPAELELLKGYNYISTNGTTISLDYLPNSLLAEMENYVDAKIPPAPSSDGTYILTCTVTDGTPAYSWESAT